MADRGSIRVTVIGATDVGKVRDHNEDNLLVADLSAGKRGANREVQTVDLGDRGLILAVADGMGGAASGEIASETAVETLHESFAAMDFSEKDEPPAETVIAGLDESISIANERIYEKGQKETEHRGMGTTMTAGIVLGDELHLAQVGDSRAYLLRKGQLVQVTKDQSLISQLIEDGTLTEEEAEKLGGRNIILQALGVEKEVKVVSKTLDVLRGDVLMLCSDGLTGMISDAQIQEVLLDADDLAAAAGRLIDLANEGGGRDNITVVVARFEGEGLREPLKPLEVDREEGAPLGGFAAPEMPTEKKSRLRPMLLAGGLALLAAIIIILLASSKPPAPNKVTFVFKAPGAEAWLIRQGDGGGEKLSIPLVAGETEHTMEGLEPGEYLLQARIANYEDYSRSVKIGTGNSRLPVESVPLPATLTLTPATLHVMVDLVDVTDGVEVPFTHELEIESQSVPAIPNVPAGMLKIVQRRDGFETGEQTITVAPGEDRTVALIALEEIRGAISISCNVAGAEVRVIEKTASFEEEAFRGVIPESGTLEAEVRVGSNYWLEVKKDGYRKHLEKRYVVKKKDNPPASVKLRQETGTLVVKGKDGATAKVFRDGAQVDLSTIEDGEAKFKLEPGTYSVKLDGEEPKEAVVEPRGVTVVEFPK